MLDAPLAWLGNLRPEHAPIGALFVFASATIEHLFPPYPGDLAVASGAALAVARHWSLAVFYGCAMAGSAVGSAVTYAAGRWLAARRTTSPRLQRWRDAMTPAARALRDRGAWAIVFSRFVPVGRAVMIVAAGYAGVPFVRALGAAVIGAALWNGVLFAAGITAGLERERIAHVLGYALSAGWGLLAVAVLAGVVWWWKARRGAG